LRELIDNDTFPPGTRLPSEADLAGQMGISRPTLREALKSLEQQAIIVRRHGVGTFVSSHMPLLESGLEVLESLQHQARRRGLAIQVRELTIKSGFASPKVSDILGLESRKRPKVIKVKRIVAIDNKPVAWLVDVVPANYLNAEELTGGFNGSVLDVLMARKDLNPTTSRSTIDAVSAGKDLGRRLGVSEDTALLKFTGLLFGFDQKILDYSLSHFVPGLLQFSFTRRVSGR